MRFVLVILLAVHPGASMTLDLPPEGIFQAAEVTPALQPATRLNPPAPVTTQVPAFANGCDEMHWYRANAGLPARFDQLGWRESNCRNEEGVHTFCCWGWWQLNVSLHLQDHRLAGPYHDCGVYSRFDVDGDNPGDKRRQACAAKALYDVVGLSAWG